MREPPWKQESIRLKTKRGPGGLKRKYIPCNINPLLRPSVLSPGEHPYFARSHEEDFLSGMKRIAEFCSRLPTHKAISVIQKEKIKIKKI